MVPWLLISIRVTLVDISDSLCPFDSDYFDYALHSVTYDIMFVGLRFVQIILLIHFVCFAYYLLFVISVH